MQICWWPLSDHWSVHLTCSGLCGMEAWKFSGAICAMLTHICSELNKYMAVYQATIDSLLCSWSQIYAALCLNRCHVICRETLHRDMRNICVLILRIFVKTDPMQSSPFLSEKRQARFYMIAAEMQWPRYLQEATWVLDLLLALQLSQCN